MTLKNTARGDVPLKNSDFVEAQRSYVKVVAGIQIEAGVPVPQSNKTRTPMARVAISMKVGDSVAFDIPKGGSAGAVAGPLEYQLKKLKRKYTHRAIDGGSAVRIWRV
jgi:hypothetical protein